MRPLAYYQALLEHSQHMARLACDQAWNDLAKIELERRSLITQSPTLILSTLPISEQLAIRALIEQIQQCDQTVREYLLPWRESVGNLLARLETKA
jgi:hypothetical protein